jgi:cysteine desulfurase / selenocysteine lyase
MSERNKLRNYRKLLVGLDKLIPIADGRSVKGINFDNAATTPPFISVLKDIIKYSPWYSSVHRGDGYKSQLCSSIYEEARKLVLDFVNADPRTNTVIFVKNATEGINKLSYRLIRDKSAIVLSTVMEHHSNDLPWRDKCRVEYIEIDSSGRLILEDVESKLAKHNGKVKLVTVTGASNVTGYLNDVHTIAALAHKYNAKILVDGAQLVPHKAIDMKCDSSEEHIDYLVFSAHKMYAPFGIGVILAPKDCFLTGEPEYKGGGTVHAVSHEFIDWEQPPLKEEAGSPNILGVIALVAAIKELQRIGLENVEVQERLLTEYALQKLMKLPYITLYGCNCSCSDKLGIIPFSVMGIPHTEISKTLAEDAGISVRGGCFCAQPYVQRLLNLSKNEIELYRNCPENQKPGLVRISFGLYNTYNEIDELINAIKKIVRNQNFSNNNP